MSKKLAVLCMAAVTAGIFLIPWLYFKYMDTRLDENRQNYQYNVNVDSSLSFYDKKEMLLNRDCLIDIENENYELSEEAGKNISQEISKIRFEDEYTADAYIKYVMDYIAENNAIKEYVVENMSFKLIYADDELIKNMNVGVCIFKSEVFKGFGVYDADTSEIYAVYIITGYFSEEYIDDIMYYDKYDSYRAVFSAEEILNSSTLNSILGKTSLENEYVYYEETEVNLLNLFIVKLKNGSIEEVMEDIEEENDYKENYDSSKRIDN